VPQGQFVALMGPNGAGKSTLLKSLYGMTTIKGGSIEWQAKNIAGYKSRAILAEGIAFVPQGRCNFPVMTIDEKSANGRLYACGMTSEVGPGLCLRPFSDLKAAPQQRWRATCPVAKAAIAGKWRWASCNGKDYCWSTNPRCVSVRPAAMLPTGLQAEQLVEDVGKSPQAKDTEPRFVTSSIFGRCRTGHRHFQQLLLATGHVPASVFAARFSGSEKGRRHKSRSDFTFVIPQRIGGHCRFSSIVMTGKLQRPCGTKAMPSAGSPATLAAIFLACHSMRRP